MDNVNTYKVNKEAVKKIAEKVYDNGSTVINRNDLEELFPELQESGDERMIKFIKQQLFNIKKTITENYELDAKLTKAIDWLEKQGNLMKALQISNAKIGELIEKNYYLKEQLEKQGEHANFLSKIQVGDKVTRNEDGVLVNISQLNRVAKKRKNQGNNMGISEATKKKLEDNLNKALEKETPESCNEFLDEQGEQKPIKEHNACEFCEDRYGCVSPCSMKLIEEQKPAEEYNITGIGSKNAQGKLGEMIKNLKQEELTEFEKAVKQVMKEAIECGDIHNLKADADLLLRIAQKTSWSEEDNRMCKAIIDNIQAICEEGYFVGNIDSDELIKWLKSLEERVQSQQQEWSEENERIYKSIAYSFAHNYPLTVQQQEFVKSLKERYTWKPSDEQMDALRYVTNFDYGGYKATLVSLYEQLKKLRGE